MDDRSFDQTAEAKTQTGARYIRFFSEIGIEDVPLVGGKNASLGEMFQELTPKGVEIPTASRSPPRPIAMRSTPLAPGPR